MKKLHFLLLTLFLTFSTASFALNVQDSSTTDSSVLTEIPSDLEFSDGQDEASSTDTITTDTTSVKQVAQTNTTDSNQEKSLWTIFIAGLVGGFLAFLMPCIFPMVPLTVSFFTKKAGSRAKAVQQALLYGFFIIVIYVALGMLVTITFGSDALNALSTNGFLISSFLFCWLFSQPPSSEHLKSHYQAHLSTRSTPNQIKEVL